MKFEINISEKKVKELKDFLEDMDVDWDNKDNTHVIKELFFLEGSHGDELDFRFDKNLIIKEIK